MISREIRSEIEHYDELGLLPSRQAKNIEEYLKQAEINAKILEELQKNPQTLAEKIGPFELIYPDKEIERQFYKKFLTRIRPGITMDENFTNTYEDKMDTVEKIANKTNIMGKISGTIYNLGSKENPIQISLLNKKSKIGPQTTLAHEMIHCIRNSWNPKKANHFIEETFAYCCLDSDNNMEKRLIVAFPPLHSAVSLIPLMAGLTLIGYIAGGLNGIAGVSAGYGFNISNQIYLGHKTKKFFERAESEGLNPHYLFTHSDPQEYHKNKSLAEQIAKSQEPRFQIMATRLGLI
jgi:hypothetical protein